MKSLPIIELQQGNRLTEAENTANQRDKRFYCAECTKYFSSKHCLREHGYSHTNQKPYICHLCQKCFKHASQLSVHKKAHRVTSYLVWPKLTDLMLKHKEKDLIFEITDRKFTLPLISKPQDYVLPSIDNILV